MARAQAIFCAHWGHQPALAVPPVRCPAFRRSRPAKAGTPNGWFMESPDAISSAHWDHEQDLNKPLNDQGPRTNETTGSTSWREQVRTPGNQTMSTTVFSEQR